MTYCLASPYRHQIKTWFYDNMFWIIFNFSHMPLLNKLAGYLIKVSTKYFALEIKDSVTVHLLLYSGKKFKMFPCAFTTLPHVGQYMEQAINVHKAAMHVISHTDWLWTSVCTQRQNLLNAGDVIDAQLFQRKLEFLVICSSGSVYNLLLSACSALCNNTHDK